METGSEVTDEDLVTEQRAFYAADAHSFDDWLSTLLDEDNVEAVARWYRAGRDRAAEMFSQHAPLGRTLELACGGGRLAELYLGHAESALLVDSSPESIAIASDRLRCRDSVSFEVADAFTWDGAGRSFDTIIFSAWLHHVPLSRFDDFWNGIERALADDGVVIFDFQDVRLMRSGRAEIPEEPSEDYAFYAPRDGISIRDHFGRRWRVVHELWHPDELASRLETLGWTTAVLGPGLFDNIVWAEARRAFPPPFATKE